MAPPRLAKRLRAIKPSAPVAVGQRAAELQAAGVDVISFSLGEPDFGTPAHICDAAKRALDAGATVYTAARGMLKLREAICADSRRRRGGVSHTPEEVVVSVGAKHALFNLALALYDEGDEVLIPAPYWVSYPEQAAIVGAKSVIIETRAGDGYRLRPDVLQAAVTPRTKALVLCSPANPTGAAYDVAALQAIAEVVRRHSFWVVIDEIYGQLVYGGFVQRSLLEIAPDLKDRILIVDGVSKTYAMTGWRIGWLLGSKAVAEACDLAQSQSTTNATTLAQHAALAALEGPQECVEQMRRTFEARRDMFVEGLNRIPGIECPLPDGAFFAFANVSGLFGRRAPVGVLSDDLGVTQYFLEVARCAVVPGSAFGAPGYVRFSYATSDEKLIEGLRRIRQAVSALK